MERPGASARKGGAEKARRSRPSWGSGEWEADETTNVSSRASSRGEAPGAQNECWRTEGISAWGCGRTNKELLGATSSLRGRTAPRGRRLVRRGAPARRRRFKMHSRATRSMSPALRPHNVWRQWRAQRVHCTPGLGRDASAGLALVDVFEIGSLHGGCRVVDEKCKRHLDGRFGRPECDVVLKAAVDALRRDFP